MNKSIAVGDLVQVVRGCSYCGNSDYVGRIFVVHDIEDTNQPSICCGYIDTEKCAFPIGPYNTVGGHPLRELKRIPPLDELTDTDTPATILEKVG